MVKSAAFSPLVGALLCLHSLTIALLTSAAYGHAGTGAQVQVQAAAHTSLAQLPSKKRRLMAWMCLEFCDETPQIVSANLREIEEHKDLFAAISFEKYTLGPDSTLVDNNLTEVSSPCRKLSWWLCRTSSVV
jgi:hypothetical protein